MAKFRIKDVTRYGQKESAYNVEPDAVVVTDAYRSRAMAFTRQKAVEYRTKDYDRSSSTLTVQGGRESTDWKHEGAVIPSGNSTTPTPPDDDGIFECHFGNRAVNSANSTTAGGTTASALTMTGGGVAAMGLQIGHLIAINVDATNGIEVRQARNIAGEVVTLCRDLSANPGAGKAVYGGTQYWPDKTIMTPWRDYQYIDGNNHRYALGGIAVSDFELSADWGGETTEVQEKFSGRGAQLVALATSIPTPPTLAGIPLVTNQGKVWIGSIKGCINKVTLKSNNGMELEENESCGPYPSGIKRTGNDGKYLIELEIDYVLEAQTHFDGVPSLTSYDTLVQLGDQAGNIIAFVCRKWVPIDVQKDDLDGQVGQFLKGRALATVDEDEIFLALL